MGSREQDDIDRETRDLNGFDIDLSGIESRNGFHDMDAIISAADEITAETMAQVEQFIQEIDRQRMIAQHAVERIEFLWNWGALTDAEHAAATGAAETAFFELSLRKKEASNKLAELNFFRV